jgi:hypothetical protein
MTKTAFTAVFSLQKIYELSIELWKNKKYLKNF